MNPERESLQKSFPISLCVLCVLSGLIGWHQSTANRRRKSGAARRLKKGYRASPTASCALRAPGQQVPGPPDTKTLNSPISLHFDLNFLPSMDDAGELRAEFEPGLFGERDFGDG